MALLKASIPNPCSYNWNKMTVTEDRKGRHCPACDKVVVDFTIMSTEELQSFLAGYKGVRTCGYFRTLDTTRPVSWYQRPVLKLHEYVDARIRRPLLRTLSLMAVGILVSLTGCNTTTAGEPAPMPERDTLRIQNPPAGTADVLSNKAVK